jgi:hypothetical protein
MQSTARVHLTAGLGRRNLRNLAKSIQRGQTYLTTYMCPSLSAKGLALPVTFQPRLLFCCSFLILIMQSNYYQKNCKFFCVHMRCEPSAGHNYIPGTDVTPAFRPFLGPPFVLVTSMPDASISRLLGSRTSGPSLACWWVCLIRLHVHRAPLDTSRSYT